MNKYEILSVLVSVLSAGIALWAIIVSRKTANEQKNIAHRTQILEARNLMATHHAKYSELLFSVKSNTKESIRDLSESAYSSLQDLLRLLDRYGALPDSSEEHPRHTRHIFFRMCESIYQAISPHFLVRNSMNIRMRYNRLRDISCEKLIEGEIAGLRETYDLESLFSPKHIHIDSSDEFENTVIGSNEFRYSVQQILKRIETSDHPKLFHEAMQKIEPFLEKYEAVIVDVSTAHTKLEDGLFQNTLEEFSLRESPELYAEYMKELAKLDLLQNLDITDIRCLTDIQVRNSIPELIFIGVLLHTIFLYAAWGNGK
ncbi:MAG: hypothetical protein ABII63_06245 [Pseudomonadota bacterium]